MKVYLAGPLFSHAEQQWHLHFKKALEEAGHTVVWPGELFSDDDVERWGDDAPRRIMETDRDALLSCEIVVALLDGAQVDDGTAWEIGFACARGIPVIGLRTDFRKGGETARGCVNAMIEGSLSFLCRSERKVLEVLSVFKAR